MNERDTVGIDDTTLRGRRPYRVRLPGFISEDEVGLGEAIRRATSLLGVRPCGGCAERAAALDRRIVFTGQRRP
jgi:hypothetical protein